MRMRSMLDVDALPGTARVLGKALSEARAGDEALLAHRASATPLELPVADIVMSGGAGVELAKQLTAVDSQLPFLTQPYDPCRLLEMVHPCLHDESAHLSDPPLHGQPDEKSEPATPCV